MSIFSVFSNEEYDSVGGTLYVDPLDWLGLHGGYHHRFYSYVAETGEPGGAEDHAAEVDTGYEVVIGAAMSYGVRRAGRVVLDFRRLTESEIGLRQVRVGAIVPLFVEGLRVAASAYLDIYDQPAGDLYGAEVDASSGATSSPEQQIGFLGEAGLYYGNGTLEAGGSIAAGATPYAEHEVRGLLKLIYNFEVSFFEEVEP
jgi:hypothetical protein